MLVIEMKCFPYLLSIFDIVTDILIQIHHSFYEIFDKRNILFDYF